MEALERISEDYEMRINLKKTKVMMFTKGQPKKVPIWHRNTELKHVHEFCYLGSLLTEDAWCDKEIKKWIAMAKVAFMRRGQLLRENIWKDLKKWMVKALGRSVALCGSETWTLRKKDIKHIQAFEMWIWCKMERISWTTHVSKFWVWCKNNILVIKQQQANWIVHVLRHDCLLKTVLEGKTEGEQTQGKQRRKMLDLFMQQDDNKISYEELKKGVESRVGWSQRNLPQGRACTKKIMGGSLLHQMNWSVNGLGQTCVESCNGFTIGHKNVH